MAALSFVRLEFPSPLCHPDPPHIVIPSGAGFFREAGKSCGVEGPAVLPAPN